MLLPAALEAGILSGHYQMEGPLQLESLVQVPLGTVKLETETETKAMQGCHFKLAVFVVFQNYRPDCYAISRDIARHGSYLFISWRMLDLLIIKLIFFLLDCPRNIPICNFI